MFLVRSAREVMDADIQVLPAEESFDEYLRQPEHAGRLRYVVVTDKGHLFGVIRVNTGLRRGLESANTGVSLRDVANRNFTPSFGVKRRLHSMLSVACGGARRSWQWLCAVAESHAAVMLRE